MTRPVALALLLLLSSDLAHAQSSQPTPTPPVVQRDGPSDGEPDSGSDRFGARVDPGDHGPGAARPRRDRPEERPGDGRGRRHRARRRRRPGRQRARVLGAARVRRVPARRGRSALGRRLQPGTVHARPAGRRPHRGAAWTRARHVRGDVLRRRDPGGAPRAGPEGDARLRERGQSHERHSRRRHRAAELGGL